MLDFVFMPCFIFFVNVLCFNLVLMLIVCVSMYNDAWILCLCSFFIISSPLQKQIAGKYPHNYKLWYCDLGVVNASSNAYIIIHTRNWNINVYIMCFQFSKISYVGQTCKHTAWNVASFCSIKNNYSSRAPFLQKQFGFQYLGFLNFSVILPVISWLSKSIQGVYR